jgi:hypothetical protein
MPLNPAAQRRPPRGVHSGKRSLAARDAGHHLLEARQRWGVAVLARPRNEGGEATEQILFFRAAGDHGLVVLQPERDRPAALGQEPRLVGAAIAENVGEDQRGELIGRPRGS